MPNHDLPEAATVYVREQEGSVTELFATVEEAMDGPWRFEDRPASAGDPWTTLERDPETGLATRWTACPIGEEAVYIEEVQVPGATVSAIRAAAVEEERERLRRALQDLQTFGLVADPDHPGFSEVGEVVEGSFLHRGQALAALDIDGEEES